MARALKSLLCLALFLTTFNISRSVYALTPEDEALQKQLGIEGRELIFQRRYPEAILLCQKIIKEFPESPLGYLGMMAVHQAHNFENYDFRFQKEYETWEAPARKFAFRIIRNPNASAWERLIAGATLGMTGLTKVRLTHWWDGLRDARFAINSLKKSLRQSPTWVDPYFGLGMYQYWRSALTKAVWFLPFFSDQRQKGMEKISLASAKGEFVSTLARVALVFIYYQEKKYAEALPMLDSLIAQYPKNIILKNIYGHHLMALKKSRMAFEVYSQVLALDPSVNKAHLFRGMALAQEGKDLNLAEKELTDFLQEEGRGQWKDMGRKTLDKIARQRAHKKD